MGVLSGLLFGFDIAVNSGRTAGLIHRVKFCIAEVFRPESKLHQYRQVVGASRLLAPIDSSLSVGIVWAIKFQSNQYVSECI